MFGPEWYDDYWRAHTDGLKDYHRWAAGQIQSMDYDGVILDIGCGDGAMIPHLAECGIPPERFHGVDFSPVAVAKYHDTGAQATLSYVERMPFSDKQFGLALCFEVLEHTDDPIRAWKEVRRVAGTVLVTVPPESPGGITKHKTKQNEEQWQRMLGLPDPSWRGPQQSAWIV